MHRAVLPLLALLAGCQTTTGGTARLGDERLELFRAACMAHPRDHDRRLADIRRLGWEPVVEAEHPKLATLLEVGRRFAALDAAPDEKFEMLSFHVETGGQTYYLVVTDVSNRYVNLLGCRLYDFDADGPLDNGLVTAWLGEEPAQIVDAPGSIQGAVWNAERIDGVLDLTVGYAMPGGAAARQGGFSGLSISATTGAR